ncbi:ferredoxin [Saccharopolyspora erythraea]|uniref:ferredoxin n=1 Tax=Saccharopolyspora erythraea TaxID=1836 RepID=UPI001BAD3334|nr:ferredoxin [Saccharopolyspora erythraea]QUH01026.1 ferredoxin [Saccharopolyspora erythraea]
MAWLVELDGDTCIGSGMCIGTAPDHFDTDENGFSCVLNERVEPADAVVDAAESCPVEAIKVRDAETGEVLAPLE